MPLVLMMPFAVLSVCHTCKATWAFGYLLLLWHIPATLNTSIYVVPRHRLVAIKNENPLEAID